MGLAHGARFQRKRLPSMSAFHAQGRGEQLAMRTQGAWEGLAAGQDKKPYNRAHGPQNEVGRAYSGLGLFRLRLGIRPFRAATWQHYRRNEAELRNEEGQGIYVPHLHQAIRNPISTRQTPKET
jgi:hypothetical protein